VGQHPEHGNHNGVNPSTRKGGIENDYLYNILQSRVRSASRKSPISCACSSRPTTTPIYLSFMRQAILSISIECCLEKGTVVVAGGAKYNSYGGTATGLATLPTVSAQ
jgi:formate C-acetyltransferase